jgi:branched-chain amino acid transport system substrate-binding protein
VIVYSIIVFLLSCPAAISNSIKIGVALPLTGPLSDIGISAVNGLQLAVEKVNQEGGISKKNALTLYIQDIETNPINVYRAVQELVSQGVKIIIGSGTSSMTILASEITNKHNIPYIDCIATLPPHIMSGFPATFQLSGSPKKIIEGFAGLLANTNLIIAYDATEWGYEIKNSIENQKQLKVVDMVSVPYSGEESFYQVGNSLKKNKDVTLMVATNEDIGLSMAKWCKKYNVLPSDGWVNTAPVYDMSWYSDLSKYLPKGILLTSIYYHMLPIDGNSDFVERFKKKHNKYPDAIAAMNWNCIWMIKDVLERVPSHNRPEEITKYLRMTDLQAGSKNILLTDGIKFDKNGINIKYRPQIIQIQNKDAKIVWPAKYKTGVYIQPPRLRIID